MNFIRDALTFFKTRRKLATFILFAVCVLTAFAMRTSHYNREALSIAAMIGDAPPAKMTFVSHFFPTYHPNFMPFTLESAMMYAYTQDIANGKGVPAVDKSLLGLEDLAPYQQMNMALEWFLGWGYRIKSVVFKDPKPTADELRFQDNPYLAQWASTQLRFWVSLTTGFIFLLLVTLRCPRRYALFGAMLHAVAIAAIARSTGQDIIRGEFCIPIIVGAILLMHSHYVSPKKWKLALLFLALFIGFIAWDLCQMIFSSLAIFEIIRFVLGGITTERRRNVWIMIAMAVALNAFVVPFNVTYQLIMSPLLLIILPTLMLIMFAGRTKHFVTQSAWKRICARLLIAVVFPLCLYALWITCVRTPEYVTNYSHFSETMAAKVKFGNVKPMDPNLLTYDARMLWTPAMHSATWEISANYFPTLGAFVPARLFPLAPVRFVIGSIPITLGLFYLMILLVPMFSRIKSSFERGLPRSLMPFMFTIGFTVGFIYIVRYHEFIMLFLCISLPLLLQDYSRAFRNRKGDRPLVRGINESVRGLIVAACVFIMIVELSASIFGRRIYSEDVQLRETAQLIEWFRRCDGMKGKGVITDFTIGPMLKAYCSSSIAMQPQFGIERIRRPTEVFLNVLYHGSEEDLAKFCNKYNAEYFVYNRGYAGPMGPYSTRYIAAAKHIQPESPVNRMNLDVKNLAWFYLIDPPSDLSQLSTVYSVFRVVKPKDKMDAMKLWVRGERAFGEGDITMAQRCAKVAVWLDPTSDSIRTFYTRVFRAPPRITLDRVL